MKAAIYARVSTTEQRETGSSLETQVRAMLEYAEREGYEVSQTLQEDFSGEYLERPELNRAKELAKAGQIDAILVYSWDRLSRDSDHQTVLRYMFGRWGVEIICISEPELEGIRLKMQRGLDAIFAEWEKDSIRERTMRGRRERARQGKLIGGYFLYGATYDRETGTREKDAQTWPVLLLMFRMIAERHSLEGVANHLNALGIPAPGGGKTWYPGTISRIIRNRAYIGETYAFMHRGVEPLTHRKPLAELRYRKGRKEPRKREEWIAMPDATPALIPLDLFEAANRELDAKATTYGVRKRRYLLGGLVRCACGARMFGTSAGDYRYYRCRAAKKGLCEARSVRADHLEQLIWEEVKHLLLNPELISNQIETGLEDIDESEQKAITQRLAALDIEERRVYRLYASGRYDQSKLDDELDRIGVERAGLEERLKEIESALEVQRALVERKRAVEEYCERARENIDDFGFEEKRLALDALNIQVSVDGKSVALSVAIPMEFGFSIASSGR